MFYLSSFTGLAFVSVILEAFRSDKALRIATFIAITIFLILLAGLRHGQLFPDYFNYSFIFDHVPNLADWIEGNKSIPADILHTYEILFIALNSFIRLFTDNSVWLFVTVASMAVGFNCYNYYKLSPYFMLSLLLYFSHFFLFKELIQIRSGLASAILLFTIPYLHHRQFWRYQTVVAIASLLHVGSLVFMPIYVIVYMDFRRSVLFGFLLASIASTFVPWLNGFLEFLFANNSIFWKVEAYSTVGSLNRELGLLDPTNLKLIVLSVIFIALLEHLRERLPYAKTMVYIFLVGTYWRLVFSDFAILAARITSFFTIVEAILIPALLLCLKEKKTGYLLIVLLAFVTLALNVGVRQVVTDYGLANF